MASRLIKSSCASLCMLQFNHVLFVSVCLTTGLKRQLHTIQGDEKAAASGTTLHTTKLIELFHKSLCMVNFLLSLICLPGQSTWCADVRPMPAQPASWRWHRSAASTRSSCWAAAWQSSLRIQRTAPGTRSCLRTPSRNCPEWTTACGFLQHGSRGDPRPSLRLPGSLSPHLPLPTAVGGAAPYLAVGGLKTASCPRERGNIQSKTKIRPTVFFSSQ